MIMYSTKEKFLEEELDANLAIKIILNLLFALT